MISESGDPSATVSIFDLVSTLHPISVNWSPSSRPDNHLIIIDDLYLIAGTLADPGSFKRVSCKEFHI